MSTDTKQSTRFTSDMSVSDPAQGGRSREDSDMSGGFQRTDTIRTIGVFKLRGRNDTLPQ